MGMGEPLVNLDNVVKTLELILDDNIYGFSKQRVTISTSGVVPGIRKLKNKVDVSLAISLHASNNMLRSQLVPINTRYPIEQLLQTCWDYASNWKKRYITFEYVMLSQINDSLKDAKMLKNYLANKPAKVNLIPFNPIANTNYACSSEKKIKQFSDYLNAHGLITTVRKNRGNDINAACGQLNSSATH